MARYRPGVFAPGWAPVGVVPCSPPADRPVVVDEPLPEIVHHPALQIVVGAGPNIADEAFSLQREPERHDHCFEPRATARQAARPYPRPGCRGSRRLAPAGFADARYPAEGLGTRGTPQPLALRGDPPWCPGRPARRGPPPAAGLWPRRRGVPPGPANGGQASAVAFANPEDGWLVVSVTPPSGTGPTKTIVLGTDDAGANWRSQWAGVGSPGQVSAVDSRHAFVLLYPASPCTAKAPARCEAQALESELLATSDGGRSWQRTWSSRYELSSMTWAGPALGLAALSKRPCAEPPVSTALPICGEEVVRTTDGGHHWAGVLATTGPLVGMARTGGIDWVAVESVGDVPSGTAGQKTGSLVVWASRDGGSHWAVRGRLDGRR